MSRLSHALERLNATVERLEAVVDRLETHSAGAMGESVVSAVEVEPRSAAHAIIAVDSRPFLPAAVGGPPVSPLRRFCPSCAADPGDPCTSRPHIARPSGKFVYPPTHVHASRFDGCPF